MPNTSKILISIGILLIIAGLALVQWQRADYENVRIEGLSKWDSFLSGISYLRKYRSKKETTSDSIRAYFAKQTEIFSTLKSSKPDSTILSMAFVGDLMWIRSGWNDFLSEDVKSSLEQHDVVFGNLESPIDTTCSVPGFWPDYQTYNSDPGLVRSFYSEKRHKNIFTALSIANNHCFDRNTDGLIRTMHFLDNEHIKYSGASIPEEKPQAYTLVVEKGIRIGYYAVCWGVNDAEEMKHSRVKINILPGIAPLNPKGINTVEIENVLSRMTNDSIDFKVLSMHWGYEYETYPDQAIIDLAHKLVVAGADLIIGSHPHVIQPDEICYVNNYSDPVLKNQDEEKFLTKYRLKDKYNTPRKALIIYSLGNFTTNMYTRLCNTGAIQSIKLVKNRLTGKTDWCSPDIQYVYNIHADPATGKRQLLRCNESGKLGQH